jgi:hypothetical protein
MYDMKSWFLMPSVKAGLKMANGTAYGIETHHTEGINEQNGSKVYAYHHDTGKTMTFAKTTQGWPLDQKNYDTNLIYDLATEQGWASPRDYKMQTVPVPMCPRFWNGDPTSYQFSKHVAYNVVTNCKQTATGDVGPAYFTIQGPFEFDFQGDVGQTPSILLTYYWGDKKNREQLFLTQTVGWCKWTHAVLTQLSPNIADYVIDSSVIHNKIVLGQVAPQFPCAPIP